MTELLSTLQDHYNNVRNRKEEAVATLRKLFIYLHSLDSTLAEIVVSYEGSGDSGHVESAEFFDSSNRPIAEAALRLNEPVPVELIDETARGEVWDPVDRRLVKVESVNQTPAELLDDLSWDVAYGQHPGFEINEGGYGKVRILFNETNVDVADDESPLTEADVIVRLEHYEVIETTNDYEYDL